MNMDNLKSFVVLVFLTVFVCGCASFPSLEDNKDRKPRSSENECDCVCGMSNRQMRVVGGNLTKVNEFPWMAGLSKGGEFICGASLITRRHVLTAAHCVKGFDIRELTIVLADHNRISSNRLSEIVVRGLKDIVEHEDFDVFTFNNDIAILELDAPVDFSSSIQTVCLPPSDLEDYSGQLAVVAGWGKTSEKGFTSNILQKVALPVWSRKDCQNSNYGPKKISKNMFCAGFPDGKFDACQGDSGGPLHMTNINGDIEIIGLVSWGRGCARPKLPGVYTKVNNYLDWVHNALDGECLCHPMTINNPRRAKNS